MEGRSFVDAFARRAVEYAHAQELIDARLQTEIWYQRRQAAETIVAIAWTAVLVLFVLITFPFVILSVVWVVWT